MRLDLADKLARALGLKVAAPSRKQVNVNDQQVIKFLGPAESHGFANRYELRCGDALRWVPREFKGWRVERCHPTTSSRKSAEDSQDDDATDNDLVLVRQKSIVNEVARFEVSDVSGGRDGNEKEKKDLVSLGVLLKDSDKNSCCDCDSFPNGRLFLVVSAEWKQAKLKKSRVWLQRRAGRRHSQHLNYRLMETDEATGVIEILKGPGYESRCDAGEDLRLELREVIRPAYRNLVELLSGETETSAEEPPLDHQRNRSNQDRSLPARRPFSPDSRPLMGRGVTDTRKQGFWAARMQGLSDCHFSLHPDQDAAQ